MKFYGEHNYMTYEAAAAWWTEFAGVQEQW